MHQTISIQALVVVEEGGKEAIVVVVEDYLGITRPPFPSSKH